jgi:hypothetical protein
MQQQHMIYIILAIAFMCYGLHACSKGQRQEGFATPLSPGSFPDASTYPLLHNGKRPGGLSNLTARDLKPYYPVFDHGYGQYTNNVRYWATPNNGKCTPPEFCGGLYNNQSIHIAPTPKPISLNSEVRRVNFYGSDTMTCPDTPPQDVANCLYYGHKTNSLVPPYEPSLL